MWGIKCGVVVTSLRHCLKFYYQQTSYFVASVISLQNSGLISLRDCMQAMFLLKCEYQDLTT